jgi:general secretion pathway protein M
MALPLPTGLLGKISALGLLLIVLLLLWLGVAAPLLSLYRDRADELAQHIALADKMAAVARTLPTLQAEAAAERNTVRPPSLLFSGATDALAAAQLQEMLEKASSTSGSVVLSAESVPVIKVGSVRRIGLRLNLSGKYTALVGLLGRVDKSTPPLLVDDLQIQGSPGDDSSDADLVVNVTIYGFRAGEQPL